jgi:hypothetical protein
MIRNATYGWITEIDWVLQPFSPFLFEAQYVGTIVVQR